MSTIDKIIAGTKNVARNLASGFNDQSNDKVVQSAVLAGSIGGAVCGIIAASAFWPLCILGGVAGSFVLAIGNWNGDFKSRALSALIGFPLGAVVAVPMAGAMIGTGLGAKAGVALSAALQKAEQPAQDGVATAPAEGKSGFTLSGLSAAFTRALKGISTKSDAPAAGNRQEPPAPKQ